LFSLLIILVLADLSLALGFYNALVRYSLIISYLLIE